jgi:hypothetical protein
MRFISLILSFIMLSGSILPGGDMHELPKMANLVTHYEEHLQESGNQLSFLEFLELHYSGPKASHSDEHDELPFHHLCSMSFLAIIPSQVYTFQLREEPLDYSVLYNFSVVRDHIPNVWQPPRV